MAGSLRTRLVAQSHAVVDRLDAMLSAAESLEIVARAFSGGEALAAFRQHRPHVVAIDGDIDGCYGARLAAVLVRERSVPIMLLVGRGQEAAARAETERRRVERVQIMSADEDPDEGPGASMVRTRLQLLGARERPDRASEPSQPLRPELLALLDRPYDAVVLLGSAGTPHMLPRLLGDAEACGVPIVVGVHHNARLSDSFGTFVGGLLDTEPTVVDVERRDVIDLLDPLTVVEASASAGQLGPDLGKVLECVAGHTILACVASGMGMQGLDRLRRVRNAGGVILVLDPSQCSQPSMPTSTIAAGLADAVVSDVEMAAMIGGVGQRVTSGDGGSNGEPPIDRAAGF